MKKGSREKRASRHSIIINDDRSAEQKLASENKIQKEDWGLKIGSLFSQGIEKSVQAFGEKKDRKSYGKRQSTKTSLGSSSLASSSTSSNLLENYDADRLSKADFKARCRFRLRYSVDDKKGSKSKKQKKFDFEDFAPAVFHDIRARCGVNTASYLRSMCSVPLSGGKVGAGKSGMLFFFSHDKKYVIKTVTKSELPFFLKLLRDYHTHIATHMNTLLNRFFGLYRMKLPGTKTMAVVVMNNLFYTNLKVHEMYDLKGSTIKRLVTEEEIRAGVKVLKDLNFKRKIHLEANLRELFFKQLRIDADFLRECNIMDYSLLLGINTDCSDRNKKTLPPLRNASIWQEHEGGVLACVAQKSSTRNPLMSSPADGKNSREGEMTYFIGVIDILQEVSFLSRGAILGTGTICAIRTIVSASKPLLTRTRTCYHFQQLSCHSTCPCSIISRKSSRTRTRADYSRPKVKTPPPFRQSLPQCMLEDL